MDSLALGHAALTVLLNVPRPNLSDAVRQPVERASDQIDQLFASLREAAHSSPAFDAIGAVEREAIERLLFTVPEPLDA